MKPNAYSLKGFNPGLESVFFLKDIRLLKRRSAKDGARHHFDKASGLRTYYLLLHVIFIIVTIFVMIILGTVLDSLYIIFCNALNPVN